MNVADDLVLHFSLDRSDLRRVFRLLFVKGLTIELNRFIIARVRKIGAVVVFPLRATA